MKTIIIFLCLIIYCPLNASEYYLDAVTGDDINGDGSQQKPWKSLSKSQNEVVGGDIVYLRAGDYGAYEENNVSRTDWVTYEAVTESDVHFDYIQIVNSSLTNTYLKFNGVRILPDDVTQTIDPQLSTSTQTTYNKTEIPVTLTNVSYFQVNDSVISGRNHWYTTALVYATSCNRISFSGNELKTAWHAFRFVTTGSNIKLSGNQISDLTGTGINTVGLGYSNMLYERNYIYETCIASYTEDYAPKATGADVHGSCISVRDGNTTIRNNIMRRCGSSSGVMFYEDDAGNDYVNENILFENNLIYDTPALHPVRISELGGNVVIRNNTIIGEEYGAGKYKYRTGILLEGIDSQNGTPSLEMYNNIVIGIFDMNSYSPYVSTGNNIFWSVQEDDRWLCSVDLISDYVYACSSGFPADPQAEMAALFANESNLTFADQHGKILDFSIAKSSMAFNFGNAANQASTSLGTLNDNFILDNGAKRSAAAHSAGAYEAKAYRLMFLNLLLLL